MCKQKARPIARAVESRLASSLFRVHIVATIVVGKGPLRGVRVPIWVESPRQAQSLSEADFARQVLPESRALALFAMRSYHDFVPLHGSHNILVAAGRELAFSVEHPRDGAGQPVLQASPFHAGKKRRQ
ncbi:hypothetical protein G7046_g9839 [Stylonectria norvegica]|nr:hypothetical protein G7046_g9839 [Stylonectria norvegica]